jgi:hypothetical protein
MTTIPVSDNRNLMPEQNQAEQWERVDEKALAHSVVEMSCEAAYFAGRCI